MARWLQDTSGGKSKPKSPQQSLSWEGSRVLHGKNGYLEVGAGRRHCGWAGGREGWVKIKNRKTKQRTWEFQRKANKRQTDAIGSSRKGCRGQRPCGSVPSYSIGEGDPEMSTVGHTMQRLNVLKITITWELYQCLNILTATLKGLRDASVLSARAALLEKRVWSQHQIPQKESLIYTPATPSSGNYQLAFPSGKVFYVHVAFSDWFWH